MESAQTRQEGCPSLANDGLVAWIVLNRPRRHNRFEPIDIETMSRMLGDLSKRGAARVLVVTANGPSFSSGFDLETLSGPTARESTAAFAALCNQLEALPIPTVCGVNGNVYGGATDFALACDFRIGVEGCRLQMSPARLGIEYYYDGLRRYVERLGLTESKRLFLTGEQVDTATMLRIGFLSEVSSPDGLKDRLSTIAGLLAQRSPMSVRGLKESLNSIARGTADPSVLNAKFFTSLGSPDAKEGLRAWTEQRPARFADA
jgi:enoyl-CoA hydratase